MRYTEVEFLLKPIDPWRDLLMVELMDRGYESFEETAHGLKTYMASADFDGAALRAMPILRDPHVVITHTVREVPDINWNARWEQEFQPVEVDGKVSVRAEFHPEVIGYAHNIIITPRMAFGTGHHATTRMMIRAMLGLNLQGQHVCDLGCGTAILAILAERLGAARVVAVDNDPAAVENARRNVEMNHCQRVVVEKGGVELGARGKYGTILANIERNTLIRAMPSLAMALANGGRLLLSGFIKSDEAVMGEAATGAGLALMAVQEEGEWVLAEWVKHGKEHNA